ncbi:hypothetical protein M9H77_27781 [Catharanthus roseus]|uniref:Uncharacterized protein n=1 Tax=Catharanthus roseus TaxID=4058 RepID=A0ACC0AHS8_CATRO|nr:hypothetical protein M9H77_27781 [Catharanthus roseus]
MSNVSSGINEIFSSTRRDPGGIGFIDEIGGNVDGLMCCTESLGFESSDERRDVDDRIIESMNSFDDELLCSKKLLDPVNFCSKLRGGKLDLNHKKLEVKKFPPPLSSLSQDGRPTFFLRPVRGDGRLMLTEVKIGRPEILRASRQDGRLRLHLIRDEDVEDEEEIEDKLAEEITSDEEEEEEELARTEEWQFPASGGGGGDGLMRCHEQVSHHPHHHHSHHHQHVWRQQFVTIR